MALEIRICIDSVTAEFVKCKEDKEDSFTKDNNHIKKSSYHFRHAIYMAKRIL
jgi:hypothetical protein